MAKSCGPAKPRGVTWKGAGGCVIVSHSRQELLAHRLDHLPLTRNDFQRLGDVLAQLRQLLRPAARTALRHWDYDALARQMGRKGFAGWPLTLKRLYGLCSRRLLLGCQLIFSRCRFQLFKLKLHLLQQSRLAFRAGAVKLAAQLLDLELEMADQRFRLERSAWALAASARALMSLVSAATRAARSARIMA